MACTSSTKRLLDRSERMEDTPRKVARNDDSNQDTLTKDAGNVFSTDNKMKNMKDIPKK